MGIIIKRILLAEDDRGTSLLVKNRLEQQGFEVIVADNGREALDIIRLKPVDLLITDVVMPEMDGVDLYVALKKNPSTASLPIIIVTDKQIFLESFSALGVDHFVAKTSDISVLLAKIREIGSQQPDAKHYRKILISGDDQQTVEQMQELLRKRECLVTVVENPLEITSKALLMVPHIILLDLMIQGDIAIREVIHSLRSYDRLKQSVILTFIHVSPESLDDRMGLREQLGGRIGECQAAGATKYVGQFSTGSFLDVVKEFGVA